MNTKQIAQLEIVWSSFHTKLQAQMMSGYLYELKPVKIRGEFTGADMKKAVAALRMYNRSSRVKRIPESDIVEAYVKCCEKRLAINELEVSISLRDEPSDSDLRVAKEFVLSAETYHLEKVGLSRSDLKLDNSYDVGLCLFQLKDKWLKSSWWVLVSDEVSKARYKVLLDYSYLDACRKLSTLESGFIKCSQRLEHMLERYEEQ